jgi:uncharacterized repeat protein (TIGR03803 family)
MTTAGMVTVRHSFSGGTDGARPSAALILANDGNLYGTTLAGGAYGRGTVFKMTLGGNVTVLYAFRGGSDGATPTASLVQAMDGSLHGTTLAGGATGRGTIFKIARSGFFLPLHAFAGADGAWPAAAMVQSSDGSWFYGTALGGGGTAVMGGAIYRMFNVSCDDAVTLGYAGGVLNMHFTLMSSIPATWSAWLVYLSTSTKLWAIPIPTVSSAVEIDVPIPGFPMIGKVGILTTLSGPILGTLCADWKTVDTGASAAAVAPAIP